MIDLRWLAERLYKVARRSLFASCSANFLKQSSYSLACFLIGSLLLVSDVSGAATSSEHIVWNRIDQPDSVRFISVIGAHSAEKIFLRTKEGVFWLHDAESWTQLPPILRNKSTGFTADIASNGTLYATTLDSSLRSSIWMWDGKAWRDLGLNHDVPVRGYAISGDQSLWAYGDWGSIFRRDASNQWHQVESPSDQHILSLLVINDSDYWVGTRGEGAFHIVGETVQHYPIPRSNYLDINAISQSSDGRIILNSRERGQFIIQDNRVIDYRPLPEFGNPVWELKSDDGGDLFVSFEQMYHLSGNNIRRIAYRDERIPDVHFLPDLTLLGIDKDGFLYRGYPKRGLFFHDGTNRSRVAGYPSDHAITLLFQDMTSDGTIDLFLLAIGPSAGPHIYEADYNGALLEITRESRIVQHMKGVSAVSADWNRDGTSDVIVVENDTAGINFWDYSNQGHGVFSAPTRLPQQQKIFEVPSDIQPVDIDRDGDLDLFLTSYYGQEEDRRGGVSLFENNRIRGFHQRLIEWEGSTGFNRHSLFADFNNDGWLDLFLSTRWISDKLYLGSKNSFQRADSSSIPPGNMKTNREGAVAIDVEGDGDQDICLINYRGAPDIWINDGNGHFTDETNVRLPGAATFLSANRILSASTADIDLDGDRDLLFAVRNGPDDNSLILLNNAGVFSPTPNQMGLDETHPQCIQPIDIDHDGDLDLFMVEEERNSLYLNRSDAMGYVTILPRGRKSNTDGLHAKVEIYPEAKGRRLPQPLATGWIGGSSFVRDPFTLISPNEITFGGITQARVDVRISFYGGVSAWYRGVPAGSRLELKEPYQLESLFYPWGGKLLVQLRRGEVQAIILSFLVASAFMFFVVVSARRTLQWNTEWVAGLIVLNQSAFWVVSILSSSNQSLLRYIAPVGFVFIGTSLPFLFSYTLQRRRMAEKRERSHELLTHLLVFSHGEWAINNLNSLRRLLPHYLNQAVASQELFNQCLDRLKTWNEMTWPNLKELINIGQNLSIDPLSTERLKEDVDSLHRQLQLFTKISSGYSMSLSSGTIEESVDGIRAGLHRLKQRIYREFSSDAVAVVQNIVTSLDEIISHESVKLDIQSESDQLWVLISGFDLAAILDNSIRNAIKALDGRTDKTIEIKLSSMGAKSHISIVDNGSGISEAQVASIFQEGVSASKSGGHGLAQAKEILKKYGGSIHLISSKENEGSEFRIDLNEGVKGRESDSADHR